MIPGQEREYTHEEFRAGIVCGVVGCSRRARHQWAYPCAIQTLTDDPQETTWLPTCDECDLRLNRVLLAEVGVPAAVIEDLIRAYALIQGDHAFGQGSEHSDQPVEQLGD